MEDFFNTFLVHNMPLVLFFLGGVISSIGFGLVFHSMGTFLICLGTTFGISAMIKAG